MRSQCNHLNHWKLRATTSRVSCSCIVPLSSHVTDPPPSEDEPIVKKSAQKKSPAKSPKEPAKKVPPASRRTPAKAVACSSSSGSDDEYIVAPSKKPAAAPRAKAKPARAKDIVSATLPLQRATPYRARFLQIKIESDSSAAGSPPPPAPSSRLAPKAKAPPLKKGKLSGSDDDEIIVKPKGKAVTKTEDEGDDSDDALLSIIHSSKDIESDDDCKRQRRPSAANTTSTRKPSAPADDDDEARLHPALQPLPEDVSKRAARSSLPLTAAPAQKQQHVLVQCDEDCADLAGDSGVIGRFKYSDGRMLLDLKGYMYEGSLVPCCSLAVVHMKPTEARVEAVLDDFMALKQIGNVYDKEVAHGNMGSDDDGSDGIVLTDDEEHDSNAGDGPKKKKESKSSKSPSSASKAKPKTSSSSVSKKSAKSKASKAKSKASKMKPAGKIAKDKAVAPKSGHAVRCTQPPQPVLLAVVSFLFFSFLHLLSSEKNLSQKELNKTCDKEKTAQQQRQRQQRGR